MKLVMKNRSQNICFGDLVSRSIQGTTTKAIKFQLFQDDMSSAKIHVARERMNTFLHC